MNIPLMGAGIGALLVAVAAVLTTAGTGRKTGAVPADFRRELRQLYARYQQEQRADVSGVIRLYDHDGGDVLKEENTFRFVKQGTGCYSRLSYVQTFMTDSLVVELDTVNEYITVSRPGVAARSMQAWLLPDSLLADAARFKVRGAVTDRGSERTMAITSEYSPNIRQYTITYDTAAYRVHRATIAWWKDGAVGTDTSRVWLARIDYRYQTFGGLDLRERIGRILTLRHGQITPTPRYRAYTVYSRL